MPAQNLYEENLTADGSTAEVQWFGDEGIVSVHGSFGGGSLALEFSPDQGTNWVPVRPYGGAGGGDGHLTLIGRDA